MSRYRRDEKSGDDAQPSFSGFLKQEVDKKQSKETERRKDEKLRVMGGLNQYNRHAVEFCYYLSNEADYRA